MAGYPEGKDQILWLQSATGAARDAMTSSFNNRITNGCEMKRKQDHQVRRTAPKSLEKKKKTKKKKTTTQKKKEDTTNDFKGKRGNARRGEGKLNALRENQWPTYWGDIVEVF